MKKLEKIVEGKIKRNGVRVRKIIRMLVKKGYLMVKKSYAVVSLNPFEKREIMNLLRSIS